MNKRKIFIAITVFVLTALLAGSLGAVTVLAWPFSDVSSGSFAYADIAWLDANGVTHGCDALGHYCPGDYVTREQMAAFLHREAGVLVAYGLHVTRDGANNPVIEDWFCNVCGYFMIMPSINQFTTGGYDITTNIDLSNKFLMCSVDGNYIDTRDAFCTIEKYSNSIITVYINDSTGTQVPAEFWVMVYGN